MSFESGDSPTLGAPQQLFELPPGTNEWFFVEPGGESFLVAQTDGSGGEDDAPPQRRGIKVVQNWTAKLQR